jgi:predicted amidohydrolase YtcJ
MCDWILYGAKIITMDPAQPEADLVAVDGNRIIAVGGSERLDQLRTQRTNFIDCCGATLMPGFIDAHCHLHAYAETLISLDLSPRKAICSIADIQIHLREFAAGRPPGTWIRGKSYNEFYLAEKRHPNRWDLDAVTPQNPVKLTHRSGHAHVLNSLALERVGITHETGDPPDGLIDRDPETGHPTGILFGMGDYLAARIPSMDGGEIERGLAFANRNLLAFGVTSIQDASSSNNLHHWRKLKSWKSRGIFYPRVSMMLGFESFRELRGNPSEFDPVPGLKPGGVKIFVHQVTGSLRPCQEELNEMVRAIHSAGLQAVIHAIEEHEIESACSAIEFALNREPRSDHRHRIEHCSVCPPLLAERIRSLGISVVTQPSFVYFSGDRYLKTVPESQRENLYPIGSMLEFGVPTGFGSDFPIVDPNPLIGVYAAVTRMTEGANSLETKQGIPISEALRMYTLEAAAADFAEKSTGSITPGKLADLILLNADPRRIEAANIKDLQIIMTMLDGRVVWSNSTLAVKGIAH